VERDGDEPLVKVADKIEEAELLAEIVGGDTTPAISIGSKLRYGFEEE
jgi:hypothetical protein